MLSVLAVFILTLLALSTAIAGAKLYLHLAHIVFFFQRHDLPQRRRRRYLRQLGGWVVGLASRRVQGRLRRAYPSMESSFPRLTPFAPALWALR